MEVTSLLSGRIQNRSQNPVQGQKNDSVSWQETLRAHMNMHPESRVLQARTIKPSVQSAQAASPEAISQERAQADTTRNLGISDFLDELTRIADEIFAETEKIADSSPPWRSGRPDFAKERREMSAEIEFLSAQIEHLSAKIEQTSAEIEQRSATIHPPARPSAPMKAHSVENGKLVATVVEELSATVPEARKRIEERPPVHLNHLKINLAMLKEQKASAEKWKEPLIALRADSFEMEREYDAHMKAFAQTHPERGGKARPEKPGFVVELESFVATVYSLYAQSYDLEGNKQVSASASEMLKTFGTQWEEWKAEQGYSSAASAAKAYEQARQVASEHTATPDKYHYIDQFMDELIRDEARDEPGQSS